VKLAAPACAQSWEDEDMPALLEDLGGALADNIRLLSSWDKCKKEVLSGSLDWTPMHTADAFWAENAPHFEERDFQARALGYRVGWGREWCPMMSVTSRRARGPRPPPCSAERAVVEAGMRRCAAQLLGRGSAVARRPAPLAQRSGACVTNSRPLR